MGDLEVEYHKSRRGDFVAGVQGRLQGVGQVCPSARGRGCSLDGGGG